MYTVCEAVELGTAHQVVMGGKFGTGDDANPNSLPVGEEFDE